MKMSVLKIISLSMATAQLLNYSMTNAVSPDDLKRAIEEKTKNLDEVHQQIRETQKQISETEEKSRTLSLDIKRIDRNVGQLNLQVKSSEIKIDKLRLEIDSLSYDINEKEQSIAAKRSAIAAVIRQIEERNRENLLVIFLKHKSLAESIFEAQSFATLNEDLAAEVGTLKAIKAELDADLEETTKKKDEVEIEAQNLRSRRGILEEQKGERKQILEQTKNQEKLFQKQLAELEKQQEAISDQISDIEEELRLKFDPTLLPRKRPGVFSWPVPLIVNGGKGRITQRFGEKLTRYAKKPHNGLDIAAPIGTEVYAAEDGEVLAVDNNDVNSWRKYQYGRHILISHANGLATLYAHLSREFVKKGDRVARGQLIGLVGNTGLSTGPHLHLTVYPEKSVYLKAFPPAAGLVPVGVVIDPEDYL